MSKKTHKWKLSKRFNRYHIRNRVCGGQSIESNLLTMDTERHKAFHFLFHNLSFDEVIALLQRVKKLKSSFKGG